MSSVLLTSAYLAPVQYYTKLYACDRVLEERCDHYVKQTYRNRCVIAGPAGPQALTIPVEHTGAGKTAMRDVRISDHGNWRHLHWHALLSAYNESPFFEYYADDIRPFFERHYNFLYDFNMEICHKMCELLDFSPDIRLTEEYTRGTTTGTPADGCGNANALTDFRDIISHKHPQEDPDFRPRRYYQVYERKHGFIPNLSILDLLFNMGPEGIFYL